MKKYRYTITFEADEEFSQGEEEELKDKLSSLLEDFYIENFQIKYEDDICIKHNDKIDQLKKGRT